MVQGQCSTKSAGGQYGTADDRKEAEDSEANNLFERRDDQCGWVFFFVREDIEYVLQKIILCFKSFASVYHMLPLREAFRTGLIELAEMANSGSLVNELSQRDTDVGYIAEC